MQLHHVQLHARYCYLFNWCYKINVMASLAHLNNFQSAQTDMGFLGGVKKKKKKKQFLYYSLFIYFFENDHLTSNVHI